MPPGEILHPIHLSQACFVIFRSVDVPSMRGLAQAWMPQPWSDEVFHGAVVLDPGTKQERLRVAYRVNPPPQLGEITTTYYYLRTETEPEGGNLCHLLMDSLAFAPPGTRKVTLDGKDPRRVHVHLSSKVSAQETRRSRAWATETAKEGGFDSFFTDHPVRVRSVETMLEVACAYSFSTRPLVANISLARAVERHFAQTLVPTELLVLRTRRMNGNVFIDFAQREGKDQEKVVAWVKEQLLLSEVAVLV